MLLEPKVFGDERGFFLESYNEKVMAELGIRERFVQDNQSFSTRNVLRGLHYQLCHPQGKLVRVVTGEIFDVAVDLRRSSPTFGRWHGGASMTEFLRKLWSQEEGQDIAEYAVMLAVILVLVVGTIRLIGGSANNVFSATASSIGG